MGEISQDKIRHQAPFTSCVYGTRIIVPRPSSHSNAAEHDRGQLEVLIDDKACMYVFDRGYLDYERFDRMTDEGYYFVSRLRKNAVVRVLDTFSVPED